MTEKGVFYFLEALRELKEKNIPFEAKLAGNIDALIKKEIEFYIEKIEEVEYLGVVKGDKKKELLQWGNIFVFPSYLIEGFPLSILEALKTGNIVITTDHPAIRDNLKNSNLYFIKQKSSVSIVKVFQKIEKEFLKNSYIHNADLLQEYSEQSFVEKIERILL